MIDDIKTHQDDIKTLTRQRADLCEDLDPELQALTAEADALLAVANEMRADREKQLGNAESLRRPSNRSKVKWQRLRRSGRRLNVTGSTHAGRRLRCSRWAEYVEKIKFLNSNPWFHPIFPSCIMGWLLTPPPKKKKREEKNNDSCKLTILSSLPFLHHKMGWHLTPPLKRRKIIKTLAAPFPFIFLKHSCNQILYPCSALEEHAKLFTENVKVKELKNKLYLVKVTPFYGIEPVCYLT